MDEIKTSISQIPIDLIPKEIQTSNTEYPPSYLRNIIIRILFEPFFYLFYYILLFFNLFLFIYGLAAYSTSHTISSWYIILDCASGFIVLIDVLLRVYCFYKTYFTHKFNIFDFCISIISFISLISYLISSDYLFIVRILSVIRYGAQLMRTFHMIRQLRYFNICSESDQVVIDENKEQQDNKDIELEDHVQPVRKSSDLISRELSNDTLSYRSNITLDIENFSELEVYDNNKNV